MAAAGGGVLFEDRFKVLAKDPEGKKFDKVSRYACKSEFTETDLEIDINCDIYPLNVRTHITTRRNPQNPNPQTPGCGGWAGWTSITSTHVSEQPGLAGCGVKP